MAYYSRDYAPCPPFYIDTIYDIFIATATESGLNETDIEYIRVKCGLEIPTTTTTSTTTTTVLSPTTTREESTTWTTTEPTSAPNYTTLNNTITTTINDTTLRTTPSTSNFIPDSHTDITTLNVTIANVTGTTNNVTIVTAPSVHISGCGHLCTIGIGTSAACFAVLILSLLGIAMLFRKGRDKRHRSTSRARASRFADMPNTDFYDSVDIKESSSKRNSGSSFLRRSGDYSNTPLTFDNPAYRRSFELRPHRYNSWYDPDATDYEYSQTNAYLVPNKSRISERRSMSASRLNDNQRVEHGGRGSCHSLHNYVPKIYRSSDERFEPNGACCPWRTERNVQMVNEVHGDPAGKRASSRTKIEQRYEQKVNNDNIPQRSKRSYRSRPLDPGFNFDHVPRNEPEYFTVDNRLSINRTSKVSPENRGGHVSRKDKNIQNKLHCDRDIANDRVNKYKYKIQRPINYTHTDDNTIISSNLHPSVSLIYKGPAQNPVHVNTGGKSYSERNYHYNGNTPIQNRHHSYNVRNNGADGHMLQTKL